MFCRLVSSALTLAVLAGGTHAFAQQNGSNRATRTSYQTKSIIKKKTNGARRAGALRQSDEVRDGEYTTEESAPSNHATGDHQVGDTGYAPHPYGYMWSNYYAMGEQATAAMYLSPYPTPPLVGHTYITYPPFMPHEYLYQHSRSYLTPNDCGGYICTQIDYGYCPRCCCSRKMWQRRKE